MEASEKATKVFESRGLNGQDNMVKRLKEDAARFYDAIDSIHIPPGKGEASRLQSLAKTELEASLMWAVKAVSRAH